MSETKQKVHLYLSVVGEEVEEQPVVKSQVIGTKSSRGHGDRKSGGNWSTGRGNDVEVGYEKKASVVDKFNYLYLMISYMMKNQMKAGWKMSTRNEKLLFIHDIVFLIFLIVQNLFLNMDYFTLKKSFRLRFKNQASVKIGENCHWRLYAAVIKGTKMFEIKTFNEEHTYSSLLIHPNHSQVTSETVGTIIHDIMGQGSLRVWRSKDIIRDMNMLLDINLNYSQVNIIMGLCVYIQTDLEDRFEYCFFAIGCAIRAFRGFLEKLLLWMNKDTKLHAVAMDSNNKILLIGYGIFPKETTDSWTWFLEKLHKCIGDLEGLTSVTNRVTSIIVSIQNVFQILNMACTLVRAYKTTKFEQYQGRLCTIVVTSRIPRVELMGKKGKLEKRNSASPWVDSASRVVNWSRVNWPTRRVGGWTRRVGAG
uniref:Transposase MuDR plant domain-containing protein n=1 Tax=Lactuca sativa TaxID=4236 RepID=A0A9R1WT41_LACSA|nr:hypothetical protein LSAT_V11C100037800 [Lactuca sativa]